jgi:hypothetical protein
MNKVSPTALAYSKNLSFDFSNTLRDFEVNLDDYSQYTYIIDVDGEVYQSAQADENSATVLLVGGTDIFINEKMERLGSSFFITEPQKVTLYKALKELSKFYDSAKITSSNDKLEISLNALYSNYCG